MAQSLNRAQLVGRVGREPEIRTTQDGKRVGNMSLATSESWRDKSSGEKRERTEWHRIVIWNEGTVNFIEQYVRKGDLLLVEGQIQTRKWTDQEGQDRYTTEIHVKPYNGQVVLLGHAGESGKSQDGPQDDRGASGAQMAPGSADFDDDIPF